MTYSAYKDRPESPTGLEHDRPYMKLDIWNPGGIERKFGHDPATYPNQDLLQHYPTIQFNPPVDTSNPAAMDSNLNIHVMPHQKAGQTSRPGFQNKPVDLVHDDYLKVGIAESNIPGLEHAARNNLPTIAAIDNQLADPATKAYTTRPGFQNKPVDVVDGPANLPVSEKESNEPGLIHAVENNIPVKPGYQKIGGLPEAPVVPAEPKVPEVPKDEECDPDDPDGTLCDAEAKGDKAAQDVEDLLNAKVDEAEKVEDLAKEAAKLEEAIKKAEEADAILNKAAEAELKADADAETQEG